jgi:hypothetical protein
MANPEPRPPAGDHPDAAQDGFKLLSERMSAATKVRKAAAAVKQQRTVQPKTVIYDKKFMVQQGRDTSRDKVAWTVINYTSLK